MFEVPDAKRVRREELYDDAGSDGDVPSDAEVSLDEDAEKELRNRLNAQLSGLLDFDITAAPTIEPQGKGSGQDNAAGDGEEEPDELAFEFRLFRDEAPSHTVVIQQNEDKPGALGAGGFVVPRKPDSCYIAAAPDAAALANLRHSAVSSDFLLADAGRRRWGLERPWRVLRISVSGKPLKDAWSTETKEDDDADTKKKRRPGKKRRIMLRTRVKAEKEKAEAARKFAETKEEHLKAKKQRLNREKKHKRRAKDKEKKAAAGTTGGDGSSVVGQGGDVEMADDASNGGSAA